MPDIPVHGIGCCDIWQLLTLVCLAPCSSASLNAGVSGALLNVGVSGASLNTGLISTTPTGHSDLGGTAIRYSPLGGYSAPVGVFPCLRMQNLLQGSQGTAPRGHSTPHRGHSAMGVHHPSQGIAGPGGTGCQRTGSSGPGPPRKGGSRHFHRSGIFSMDPRESRVPLRAQMDPPQEERYSQDMGGRAGQLAPGGGMTPFWTP